jgi:hypothetical protein
MAELSFAEQMSTLNSTLGAIEARLALGRAPVEGLEDFKSLLSAAGGADSRGFQELFRIRRATEMCRALGDDLHSGSISGRHRELASLGEAAADLAKKVEQARRDAY